MRKEKNRKFQMYKLIYARRQDILDDAKKLAESLKFPTELKGKFALTSAHSSFPGPIAKDVLREMNKAGKDARPMPDIVDDLRDTVKDHYGDEYEADTIASGEAELWISFDSLVRPSKLGRVNA